MPPAKPTTRRPIVPKRRLACEQMSRRAFEKLEPRHLLSVVSALGPGANWVANAISGEDTFPARIVLQLDTTLNGKSQFNGVADDSLVLTGQVTIDRSAPVPGPGGAPKINLSIKNFDTAGVYTPKTQTDTHYPFELQAGASQQVTSSGSLVQNAQNPALATMTLNITFNLTGTLDKQGTITFSAAVDRFVPYNQTFVSNTVLPITSAVEVVGVTFTPLPPQGASVGQTFVLGSASGSNAATGSINLLASVANASSASFLITTVASTTTHGTLQVNIDGTFSYRPGPTFAGFDQFTYIVNGLQVGTPQPKTAYLLSYNASLVDKLYQQVLNRSAETAGLAGWTQQLNAGASLDAVAQGIFLSPERLTPLVTQFYNQYLGRSPDNAGLNYWIGYWQQHKDPGGIVLQMLSGAEFLAMSGGTADSFVVFLYAKLLNRGATVNDRNYWDPRVQATNDNAGGASRYNVASNFYQSQEFHQKAVDFLFSEYFKGAPAPASTPFVGLLNQGATRTQVELAIVDSAQYQNTPPPPPSATIGRALYEHLA